MLYKSLWEMHLAFIFSLMFSLLSKFIFINFKLLRISITCYMNPKLPSTNGDIHYGLWPEQTQFASQVFQQEI